MVAINQTAQSVGIAMRQARVQSYIPRMHIATLLGITEPELTQFENGIVQVPTNIMQLVFMNAYMMMRVRHINVRYREYAKRLHELNALGIPDNIEDLVDDNQPDDKQ